jgi:hypothetical protein
MRCLACGNMDLPLLRGYQVVRQAIAARFER